MRTKEEILSDLHNCTLKLDQQHKDIALVAIIETEVQIDIRDIIKEGFNDIDLAINNIYLTR